MQIYLVSTYKTLYKNTGLVKGSFLTYDAAYEVALIGEYIHSVTVDEIVEMVSAGKMAKVVK